MTAVGYTAGTKHTLAYQPTDTTSANAVAWAEMRNREVGTWPARGTFEY